MRDRWWREAWHVHSPVCLEHDPERSVHLFPFWEFYQLLQEWPLQKGPARWQWLAAAPPGGHLVMGLVLGGTFITPRTDRGLEPRPRQVPAQGHTAGKNKTCMEGRPPSSHGSPETVTLVFPRSFLDPGLHSRVWELVLKTIWDLHLSRPHWTRGPEFHFSQHTALHYARPRKMDP